MEQLWLSWSKIRWTRNMFKLSSSTTIVDACFYFLNSYIYVCVCIYIISFLSVTEAALVLEFCQSAFFDGEGSCGLKFEWIILQRWVWCVGLERPCCNNFSKREAGDSIRWEKTKRMEREPRNFLCSALSYSLLIVERCLNYRIKLICHLLICKYSFIIDYLSR